MDIHKRELSKPMLDAPEVMLCNNKITKKITLHHQDGRTIKQKDLKKDKHGFFRLKNNKLT